MRNKNERGQVALILVLAATVAGTLVISLADRSTRGLRTQTLDTEKVKALKGAESGVERALLSQSSVAETSLGSDGVSFRADYINEGGNGLVSADLVEPGDTFAVLLDGASAGVNQVNIYFSSESLPAAVRVAEYRANVLDEYWINSYAFDGDAGRTLTNKFLSPSSAGYVFRDTNFANRISITVDPNESKLLRIVVLYAASKVGVEPVGGSLPEQQLVISSLGSYSTSSDASVQTRLELRKEMEKTPIIFDKVLYSNSKIIQ